MFNRIRSADKQAPVAGTALLSLHANVVGDTRRGPSRAAGGICFYTSEGQTGSDRIATGIHRAFEASFPGHEIRVEPSDGDPDVETDFDVLRKSDRYAVLGEAGFFTNMEDAHWTTAPTNQRRIAEACFRGLGAFIRDS